MIYMNECPKCESMDLSRSWPQGWIEQRVLPLLDIQVLCCMECNARFYYFRFPPIRILIGHESTPANALRT